MRTRLALVALIVCFHWRQVFSTEFTWLEAPGVYERTLPLMQFQAGEIHKFRLPLWDPYSNGGESLLGFGQPSAFYPPHLAFLALPLKNGWLRQAALHWYFVAIQIAMALAMHSFARSALRLTESAALLSACVYALAGSAAASQQPHVLHAAVWVPLAFRHAVARDPARAALCLGLCWWPGSFEVPAFATLGLLALSLHWLRTRQMRARQALAVFGHAFSIAAIAILPAAPQWSWPELSFGPAAQLAVASAAGWAAQLGFAVAWRRRVAAALCAGGSAALFFAGVAWTLRLKIVEELPILTAFLALALALLFWKGQPRNAPFAALVLFLSYVSQNSPSRWQSRFDHQRLRQLQILARDADVAAYLQRVRNDLPRVAVDRQAIPYDFGSWWGVETYPRNDANYSAALWISRQPKSGFSRLLFESATGVNVYGTDSGAESIPRPRMDACPSYAAFENRLAGRLQIDVDTPCDGMLLTGNRFAPGWRATVDGRPTQVRQLAGGLQGIPVTRGPHHVKAWYLPITFLAGSAISAVGLLLCALAFRSRINYS